MNKRDFKKILYKDKRDSFIAGIIIAVIIGPGGYYLFISGESVPYIILSALFLILSAAAIIRAIIGYLKIKLNKNQILNAISIPDRSFLVWIYFSCKSEYRGKTKGIDICSVELVDKNGKKHMFNTNSSEEALAVTEYLAQEFPNALIGENIENRNTIETRFKKRIY